MEPYQRPIYRIEVDGLNITRDVSGRLSSLTLTDNRGFDADQLDIVLDDSDGKLDLPPRGAELRVFIGWSDTGLVDKGSYTVDEVGHRGAPDTLTIRARSADLRAGLSTQHERSWHYTTLRDIVNTIAGENDLQPVIASVLAGQFIQHIDQTNESSASFLTRLAEMFDAVATVKSGKLLFYPAAAGASAGGKPLPVIAITRATGDQHDFTIADRDAYTAVKATYNDLDAKKKGEVIWSKLEDDAEMNRRTQAPATQPPATGKYKDLSRVSKSRPVALRLAQKTWKRMSKSQRAGYIGVAAPYHDRNLHVSGKVTYGIEDEQKAQRRAKKTAAADAAKLSAPAPAVAIDHSADNIKVLRHVYANQENAKRGARTAWRRIQRGMAEFSITLAQGRPDLVPDTHATVQGFKPAIDNTDWVLIKVTHTLNDSGYTTQLALEIKATELPG